MKTYTYIKDMEFDDFMLIFDLHENKHKSFAIFDRYNQIITIPDRRGFSIAKIFHQNDKLYSCTESKPLTNTESAKSKLFLMKLRLKGYKERIKEQSKLNVEETDDKNY